MQAEAGGSGKLIEGWYTRSSRDSVIAVVQMVPPGERDMNARPPRRTAQRIKPGKLARWIRAVEGVAAARKNYRGRLLAPGLNQAPSQLAKANTRPDR